VVLLSPISGGFIPISNPQHETNCCCAGLNWRYAALVISGDIPIAGKLVEQAGKACWLKQKGVHQ
jgi:hypothetical protein